MDHSHKQSEGLGGVLWVHKVGLKMTSHCNGKDGKTSLSPLSP